MVSSTYPGCPADEAGLKPGDIIVAVAGEQTGGLAPTFRRVWSLGPAGTEIPLTVLREGQIFDVVLHSIDRNLRLISGKLH